jgi:hypothetical protein
VIAARSAEVKGTAQDAFASMAELIRSFPDRAVTTAQWDPAVVALYQKVKRELERQGMGSLEVTVDDPASTVFVDEQFQGPSAKLTLTSGRYRVYVARGREPGRVHDVDVAPGGSSRLDVSWPLDGALRSSGSDVMLALDRSSGFDTEVTIASQLGRALGAKTVVVLSVRTINGRRAIAGYAVDVESQTRRYGALQIEPLAPSTATLEQLAALLAGEKGADASGLITTEPPPMPLPGFAIERQEEPSWYDDRVAVVLGGAGLLLLGGGSYAEIHASSLDDQAARETMQTERARIQDQAASYRTTGEVLFIAGGVAIAAGIVKHIVAPPRRSSAAERISLDIAPSWIGVSARF